jgi:hypothetical protein
LTGKLPDIVQIQLCPSYGPQEFGGATMEKLIIFVVEKKSFKIFSRTRLQISIKCGTSYSCKKEIQVCSNIGSRLLQKEGGWVITKAQK